MIQQSIVNEFKGKLPNRFPIRHYQSMTKMFTSGFIMTSLANIAVTSNLTSQYLSNLINIHLLRVRDEHFEMSRLPFLVQVQNILGEVHVVCRLLFVMAFFLF